MLRVSDALRVHFDLPEDFRRFSVRVEVPAGVRLALAGTATLEGRETAWVEEAASRAWAGLKEDRAWQAGPDGMIAEAEPHGWVHKERRIKAHLEWRRPSPQTTGTGKEDRALATRDNKVYSKTEIVGTSNASFEDAVTQAIGRAQQTLRNLRWFEVTEQRGAVYEGEIEFQATIEVGFELEGEERGATER